MSYYLYVTADKIGLNSGGGKVTHHELLAMTALGGSTGILGHDQLGECEDPWGYDRKALALLKTSPTVPVEKIRLAHFYAGTFTETVKFLQANGVKVTYMAAAHDVQASKQEHMRLGLGFNYPHLTDPVQWAQYIQGYRAADVLICPSLHSAGVMRGYHCGKARGCNGSQPIAVIPHGVDVPQYSKLVRRDKFVVGYLGAVGPDKGLQHLLKAWGTAKGLLPHSAELHLAGPHSKSEWVVELVKKLVPSRWWATIKLLGWMEHVSDFYDNITLYVQPSVTEGFGIEVLEAYAHNRVVLCSTGAGACDAVTELHEAWFSFPPRDDRHLAQKLVDCHDLFMRDPAHWVRGSLREAVKNTYAWPKIEAQYVNLWKNLLKSKEITSGQQVA